MLDCLLLTCVVLSGYLNLRCVVGCFGVGVMLWAFVRMWC